MPVRGRTFLVALLAVLALSAMAGSSFAQTSSDVPGGNGSLRPVGVGENSPSATTTYSSPLWNTLTAALRDRIVPLPWLWIQFDAVRRQPAVHPVPLAMPRRPVQRLGR